MCEEKFGLDCNKEYNIMYLYEFSAKAKEIFLAHTLLINFFFKKNRNDLKSKNKRYNIIET
jgi:hypothetical protein